MNKENWVYLIQRALIIIFSLLFFWLIVTVVSFSKESLDLLSKVGDFLSGFGVLVGFLFAYLLNKKQEESNEKSSNFERETQSLLFQISIIHEYIKVFREKHEKINVYVNSNKFKNISNQSISSTDCILHFPATNVNQLKHHYLNELEGLCNEIFPLIDEIEKLFYENSNLRAELNQYKMQLIELYELKELRTGNTISNYSILKPELGSERIRALYLSIIELLLSQTHIRYRG